MLEMGFYPDGICGVDEDASVLGSDDGFNHRGQVVDIREGFHAEDDIVVGLFARVGFFRSAND